MKVGVVTHYYPRLEVAIVSLVQDLHIGDRIKFSGSQDFSQTVTSMQVEHEHVESASSGSTIGLKTTQPVRPGDEIVSDRI